MKKEDLDLMKNTLKLGLVPGKFEGTCEWKKIEKKNGIINYFYFYF